MTSSRLACTHKGPAIIGVPFNVVHDVHVRPDSSTATGFVGLPTTWDRALQLSGISRDDVKANPQAVLDALQLTMEGPPQRPPPLPSRNTVNFKLLRAFEFNNTISDPRTCFRDFVQLGQWLNDIMNRFPPGVAHFLNRAVIHRLLRRIRLQEKIERDTLSALLLFILVVRSRAKRHRIHLLLVEIQQSNLWQCVHASLIEAREDPLLARIACRLVCEVCALDDLLPGSDLVLRVEIMSALTEIICESCEVRQAACEALIAITPPLNAAGRRKIHTHQVHKLMRLMTLELETSSRAYPEATIGLLSLLRWKLFPRKACGVNIYLCIQPLLTGAYLGQVVGLRIIYDNLETKLPSMVTAMHFPCRTGPGPLSQRSICEGTCTISASLSWLLVHASPDISRIASKILRLLPDYEKEAVSVLARGGCAPILWLAENHECKTVRSTMFHTTRKISDCIKHHLLSLPPASRSPQLSVAINGAFGVLKIITCPPPTPTCPPPTAHIASLGKLSANFLQSAGIALVANKSRCCDASFCDGVK